MEGPDQKEKGEFRDANRDRETIMMSMHRVTMTLQLFIFPTGDLGPR